jgi:hypothetical protein
MTRPRQFKSYVRSSFPRAVAAYENFRRSLTAPSLEIIFTEIYHNNAWNDPESASGRGSTVARTDVVRTSLPTLLRELQTKTLLDAACGDFNWIRCVEIGDIKYIGVDVVRAIIERNSDLYGQAERTFASLDITRDNLPHADVILCRDCFIHLSFARIKQSLAHFKKSGAKYLLCTTHTAVAENVDCPDGGWRSVNLEIAPFNFPPPMRLIVEDKNAGKCLGVWRLSEL